MLTLSGSAETEAIFIYFYACVHLSDNCEFTAVEVLTIYILYAWSRFKVTCVKYFNSILMDSHSSKLYLVIIVKFIEVTRFTTIII